MRSQSALPSTPSVRTLSRLSSWAFYRLDRATMRPLSSAGSAFVPEQTGSHAGNTPDLMSSTQEPSHSASSVGRARRRSGGMILAGSPCPKAPGARTQRGRAPFSAWSPSASPASIALLLRSVDRRLRQIALAVRLRHRLARRANQRDGLRSSELPRTRCSMWSARSGNPHSPWTGVHESVSPSDVTGGKARFSAGLALVGVDPWPSVARKPSSGGRTRTYDTRIMIPLL